MTPEEHQRQIAIRRVEHMKQLKFVATAFEIVDFYAQGMDATLTRYLADLRGTIERAKASAMARVDAGEDTRF